MRYSHLIIYISIVIVLSATALYASGAKEKRQSPAMVEPENAAAVKDSETLQITDPRYIKPPDEVLRQILTPLQYEVTQKDGTERAFANEYWDNKEPGIYVDIVSGEPLFSSLDKYTSGTGWPSFTRPLVPENIVERIDTKLFAPRTEIRSAFGDSHLGHVFTDGPEPTGLRSCMDSAALRFVPVTDLEAEGYGEFLPLFE